MKYYANFKINKTVENINEYFKDFNEFDVKGNEVCFYVSPALIQTSVNATNFNIGAQNIATSKWGALTGETSIEQVVNLGAKSVLIGHSERRNIFGETDEDISSKIKLAKEYDIEIVLCVGEKLEEREHKKEVIEAQIKHALNGVSNYQNIVIAYEPVWAIGTGVTAEPKDIEEMVKFINNLLEENYKVKMPILYGGSVKASNVGSFKSISGLSGFLVGGASLNAQEFYELIKA